MSPHIRACPQLVQAFPDLAPCHQHLGVNVTRVVAIVDESRFAAQTATLLMERRYEALAISDAMVALDVLESPTRTELLITSVDLG